MLLNQTDMQLDQLRGALTLRDFTSWLPSILTAEWKAPVRPSTLQHLRDELIEPFRDRLVQAEATDSVVTKIAPADSAEAAMASHMLTYGYCSHYFTGKD